MGLLSRVKTWIEGDTLTAADLNAEIDNIVNTGLAPTYIDDDSANEAGMQAVVDPYPDAAASLPTTLKGELERLRYLIKQITGEAQWYIDPDSNIATIAATAGIVPGDADYKLFTNAAGSAAEWAKGIYTRSITRDTTAAPADVSYTGVGFKGSLLIVSGSIDGASMGTIHGTDDGTNRTCVYHGSDGSIYSGTSYCITVGTTAGNQKAVLKSWDADGFTLTWTKTGSPTGTATLSVTVLR